MKIIGIIIKAKNKHSDRHPGWRPPVLAQASGWTASRGVSGWRASRLGGDDDDDDDDDGDDDDDDEDTGNDDDDNSKHVRFKGRTQQAHFVIQICIKNWSFSGQSGEDPGKDVRIHGSSSGGAWTIPIIHHHHHLHHHHHHHHHQHHHHQLAPEGGTRTCLHPCCCLWLCWTWPMTKKGKTIRVSNVDPKNPQFLCDPCVTRVFPIHHWHLSVAAKHIRPSRFIGKTLPTSGMVICRVEQVEGRLQPGTKQTLLKAFVTTFENEFYFVKLETSKDHPRLRWWNVRKTAFLK